MYFVSVPVRTALCGYVEADDADNAIYAFETDGLCQWYADNMLDVCEGADWDNAYAEKVGEDYE